MGPEVVVGREGLGGALGGVTTVSLPDFVTGVGGVHRDDMRLRTIRMDRFERKMTIKCV